MCRRVNCKICQRPTWAGCGAHVEQVLGDVPKAQRCQGHKPGERPTKPVGAKKSFLDRVLNR